MPKVTSKMHVQKIEQLITISEITLSVYKKNPLNTAVNSFQLKLIPDFRMFKLAAVVLCLSGAVVSYSISFPIYPMIDNKHVI